MKKSFDMCCVPNVKKKQNINIQNPLIKKDKIIKHAIFVPECRKEIIIYTE